MIGSYELAVALAVGGVSAFVGSLYYPTRSNVRQAVTLSVYAVIAAGSALYLSELKGFSHVLDQAWRDYVMIGVLGFIGLIVMVATFDIHINFDTLKDDPAYALVGRSGLAVMMVVLAICAMAAVSIAWYQVDPTIIQTRSNITFLYAAGAQLTSADLAAFALDQTQKALLFDISEVYSLGIIDIGNNPAHLAFSTACLIYRTFLSVFVITIALRLVR